MGSAAPQTAGRFLERPHPAHGRATRLRPVHEMFEAQAERTPHAVAATCRHGSITFEELNQCANRLAHRLASLGVRPEVLVGVCAERSIELVVGLLAVLKAGGAYLPLDPSYPAERLAWMQADARLDLILSQEEVVGRLPSPSGRVVLLDEAAQAADGAPAPNPATGVALGNLAYVIYTSGSTGRPKGAMISHRGLANYLAWCTRAYAVDQGEGAPVHSSIAFDLTITSLWAPLVAGRRVDLLDEDLGVEQLAAALRTRSGYSLVKITPAHLQLLSRQLAPQEAPGRTRAFIIGGEQLTADMIAFWQQWAPDTMLVNEYGPTETVVGCCAYRVKPGEPVAGAVPIGRPIANTRLYVLDARLQPVPIGVAGELYVGGAGVARGYWNQPSLTAERFLPDPFSRRPGSRIYRTGDLVRYRSDGQLEFLGRVDRQVKIRGFRVEPGEVESALGEHPSVREAVVLAREDVPGDRRLVAYLSPRRGSRPPELEDLRQYLRAKLPEALIPSAFVVLDSLPLTLNGKVDRDALPPPEARQLTPARPFQGPRNATEAAIVETWTELLGVRRVSVNDDFFELGGHSLLATQVVSRLRQAFGVEVALRELFADPTVAGLARRVEAARRAGNVPQAPGIVPVPRGAPLPLSYAQQALWFLDQLSPGQATFNVTAGVRIQGQLDVPALEQSLNAMLARHESLRTTFACVEGAPVQIVAAVDTLPLRLIDLRPLAPAEREPEARRLGLEAVREPFDLERGPLVRAALFQLDERDHALLLTMHHIVTDGWSFGVAARELAALYEAAWRNAPHPLPELAIQYADYAVWQRQWLEGPVRDRLLEYWTRQLAGVAPLELPTDHPRPLVRTARGALEPVEIPPDLARQLDLLSRREGATLFMTLLAAFQTLLHRYTGQADITVGSPVANRTRAETEGLIGYFVNMLALRTDCSGNPTFRELLARVREVALEAFEHQDLPLEVLIESLALSRDLSRTPLFQVMFVLQNNRMPEVSQEGLTLGPLDLGDGTGTAKFDLSLSLEESPTGLAGTLEYNTDLFEAATIRRLVSHFQNLLRAIATEPDARLGSLAILRPGERQELSEWGRGPASRPAGALSTAHALFEAQVRRSPQATAFVAGAERLTYEELSARANRVAHVLRTRGVGPEVRVALDLIQHADRLIALLGVLKAGGAYVPLDTNLPRERLGALLRDTNAALVLTDPARLASLPHSSPPALCVDLNQAPFADSPRHDPAPLAQPPNLAYMIYTSGSTGAPKGVMVSHASLVSAYHAWEEAYELRATTSCHLQMAGFAFDVYTGDWIRALASGASLVACPPEVLLDPPSLYDLIVREHVDCAEFVPAVMELLLAHVEQTGRSLDLFRLLVVGSDMWHAGHLERLRRVLGEATRVVNSYGVTEATIDSLYFDGTRDRVPPGRPVPIGRPFAGSTAYVLDQHRNLVPAGVVGELYLGGAGLARGYHGRPGLTAAGFLPDPFSAEPGDRMYRTGDLARWRADGQLELIGRLDHQVKIRGFRVELGDLESALARHSGIREAVAAVETDASGDKVLVAHLVPHHGVSLNAQEIRNFLKDRLPRYMIPAAFAFTGALPLTPSGKVDRPALPRIGRAGEQQSQHVPPRDDLEAELCRVWEQVLGVHPVGITDHFFDLGGHSLMAVRLMNRVEARFGQRLPISAFFQAATVEDLARVLREGPEAAPGSPLVPIQPAGSGMPVFLVHPIGGNVHCYRELAGRLGPHRAVCGLQAAGLEGERTPETSLPAMAAAYLDAIQSIHPRGPYRLAGWSLGGVVAYEMARQLECRGDAIATLVLIDTPAPGRVRASALTDPTRSLLAFAEDLARSFGATVRLPRSKLIGLDTDEQLRRVLDRLSLDPELASYVGIERMRGLLEVFRANQRALAGYEPEPYRGSLVLVRAKKTRSRSLDPALGWNRLAKGGVTVHTLPGDHYSLLQRPAVDSLAELLRPILDGPDAVTGKEQGP